MKEISEKAHLSKIYTNHQIRKTTATGMHQEGFSLQEIAHVTKHKNLDSLKHYVSAPTLHDKQRYNDGLFSYANPDENSQQLHKRSNPDQNEGGPSKTSKNKENVPQSIGEMQIDVVPSKEVAKANSGIDVRTDMRSVINNEL